MAFATSNPLTASPSWTDVSADLIDVTISRGRQRELDQCDAGQATFTFDNASWQYLPGYSGGANYPNVLPLKQIEFQVTVGATTYTLFRGFVDRWETQWHDPSYSTMVVQATDALGLFAVMRYTGLLTPVQSVQARITAILNSAKWPSGLMNIGAGSVSCGALNAKNYAGTTATILSVLQQAADTQPGTLFADGSGIVQFFTGFTGSSMTGTLGDRPDLGEVQIDDAVLSLADDTVFNNITGSRDGAQAQSLPGPGQATVQVVVNDSGSQTEFGFRTLSKQTFNGNDSDLTTTCQSFLARYKYPTQLFDLVTIMPAGDLNSAYAFCCSCEIGKTVTLNRTPPAATGLARFSQSGCVINYLTHTIKPGGNGGDWQTDLRLAGGSFH